MDRNDFYPLYQVVLMGPVVLSSVLKIISFIKILATNQIFDFQFRVGVMTWTIPNVE